MNILAVRYETSLLVWSRCRCVYCPIQQQPAEVQGVGDGEGAGEVLADEGRGDAVLPGHGRQGGQTLLEEVVCLVVKEHQDLTRAEDRPRRHKNVLICAAKRKLTNSYAT